MPVIGDKPYQLLDKVGREQIVHACLKSSYIWEHVTVLKLVENMCLRLVGGSEQEFTECLLYLGDRKLPIKETLAISKHASLVTYDIM